VEYVGDYPENSSPSQLLNSGGSYHLSPTQQVDFHVALGSIIMPRATLWRRVFIPD